MEHEYHGDELRSAGNSMPRHHQDDRDALGDVDPGHAPFGLAGFAFGRSFAIGLAAFGYGSRLSRRGAPGAAHCSYIVRHVSSFAGIALSCTSLNHPAGRPSRHGTRRTS